MITWISQAPLAANIEVLPDKYEDGLEELRHVIDKTE